MKINKKIAISGTACALALITAVAVILPKEVNAEAPRRREYPVKRDSIVVGIDASGAITSKKQSQFVDAVLQIDEYKVALGDYVKKGDTIATLSAEDIAQKKRIAEDKLRSEQAAYQKLVAEKQAFQQNIDKQIYDVRLSGETAYTASVNVFITKRAVADQGIKDKLAAIAQSNANIATYTAEKNSRGSKIATINSEITTLQGDNTTLQAQIDVLIADTANDNTAEIATLMQKKLDNDIKISDKTREKSRLENTDYDSLIAEETQKITQNNAEIVVFNAEVVSANNNITYCDEQRRKDKEKENLAVDQIVKQGQAQANVLDSQINTAKTTVDLATKELDAIKKYDISPIITAEYDGVVTKMGFGAKATIDKAVALVEIGAKDEKVLVIAVDPADIADVEDGQEVSFYVDAFQDATFNGKVKSKSYLQNSNGKFEVSVGFDDEDNQLLDGMGANATLIIKQKLDVVTLSNKAVLFEDNKSYVNVLDEKGNLQKKQIKTGFSNGRITEVLEGLADGDVAIVEEHYEN